MTSKKTTPRRPAASIGSLDVLAKKGEAAPAVPPLTEDGIAAASPVVATATPPGQEVPSETEPSYSISVPGLTQNVYSGLPPKVQFSVKIEPAYFQRLKVIVGLQQAERMVQVSQQDVAEQAIREYIDKEWDRLTKKIGQ